MSDVQLWVPVEHGRCSCLPEGSASGMESISGVPGVHVWLLNLRVQSPLLRVLYPIPPSPASTALRAGHETP